jgi:menaquinone-9 beta-reductase
MGETKRIQIVGGGLAGLTLGIGLRQRDVLVTILEAGNYPRHRVCGEFISGRGQATLGRLKLSGLLEEAGGVRAETAAFFSTTKSTAARSLPVPAICLSRFLLDAALAKRFRALGGELREGERSRIEHFGEGMVRATGRRAGVEENGARWFGLKIHARNVSLAADLEMHVLARGYVGLCKINDGEVNVCGLFRASKGENRGAKNAREWLRGPAGSWLQQRMAGAEFIENSFCAVAGISLRPEQAASGDEIRLGDAITMIPPVTGNGMSMAFESAELAIEPLAAWSRGELTWKEARQNIGRKCDAVFARRLACAKWLQRIILTPAFQTPLIALAARHQWVWRRVFESTR